jgi:hypothetical protein
MTPRDNPSGAPSVLVLDPGYLVDQCGKLVVGKVGTEGAQALSDIGLEVVECLKTRDVHHWGEPLEIVAWFRLYR